MVQNLKVDIIYHATALDFEMEFNLCGCCKMRLLSDRTTDKKLFVRSLARAVSRSRVIIACGPLFGKDGLISIVSTAIGSGVALCDNKTYGINNDEPISIINGSTPLVTPDGYFGGCIIESGPQTIILLTENRAFRKAILKNLIHPYLSEISYIPAMPIAAEQAPEETPEYETALCDGEEYVTADEEYVEQSLETPADEHNVEFVMDGEETTSDAQVDADPTLDTDALDSVNLMYTEIETESEIKSRYKEPYKPSESDNMFIASRSDDYVDNDEYEHTAKQKGQKSARSLNITIVILTLLLLLAVLAIVYLIVLRPMTMGVSTSDYVKEIFGLASENSSTLV